MYNSNRPVGAQKGLAFLGRTIKGVGIRLEKKGAKGAIGWLIVNNFTNLRAKNEGGF